jgi:signal transduction histidine kinase/ActR/RegA family two-component response regulator
MRTFSIKQKLLLITMASSAAALLLVALAFLTLQFFSFRQNTQDDLSVLANVIGEQNSTALVFGDRSTAAKNLKTLASQRASVIAACLYETNAVFATYNARGKNNFAPPLHPGAVGWKFADGHIAGFQRIIFNGEDIGAVYICSDLQGLYALLWRYTGVIAVFVSSSLFVAYVLASRLQRIITRPISHLAETAEIISSEENYSVRARKESDDELGQLIDVFNGMLAQIQAREGELKQVNDQLEKRVETRTLDLQQQLNRISLLNQITFAVVERQDSESIVMVVLQQLEQYLPLDYSSAYWFEAVTKTLKVMARGPKAWNLVEQFQLQPDMPITDTPFEKCVEGEIVYLPDISKISAPVTKQIAQVENFSCLALPLFLDGKMFGLLVFMRRQLDGFSEAERDFMRNLSTHVALAIRQAQLYEDLQKAYNELHQTQQAIMQQERLKALGQMASGIAHDINNALSPVVGFAELIALTEPNMAEDTKKYLHYIKTAGQDITHIVAGLREFYRMRDENEALVALDLNRLAEEAVDMTRPRWRDLPQRRSIMIEVQKDFAPKLPEVVGIESEIREALTNLIINAVDALPTGGIVTVRTQATAANVILEVTDTGIGMDEQTRKRCLEPFFSTKGRRGTGLGLAMVYGIMERHEGKIEIDSELGKGTTMRLVFPARKMDSSPSVAAEKEIIPGPFRILCIDDEPAIRELIYEMLNHDGHQVEVTDGGKSGVSAFRAARDQGTPFDIVITDLGMPYMDGREVANVLKIEAPATPVVMLTGWGAFMQGEHSAQIDRIMSKPPSIREIRTMLREVVPGAHAKS